MLRRRIASNCKTLPAPAALAIPQEDSCGSSCSRSFASIPKDVYDPMRHNPKWYDSYAKPIADRRNWPTKKYEVGLEPENPSDWLQYSKRNLAYQYNGAMRAKSSFPELLPLYNEMKVRGVKVDIDTMFIMLSRAARYEKISVKAIFELYHEMIDLGARPDIAIAELLQTILQHHKTNAPAQVDEMWYEVRRQELIALYSKLAADEVQAYGEKGFHSLMRQQFQRYRSNILALKGTMPEQNWIAIISRMTTFDDLMEFTAAYLWDFIPESKQAKVATTLKKEYRLDVPQVYVGLNRPEPREMEEFGGGDVAGGSKNNKMNNSLNSKRKQPRQAKESTLADALGTSSTATDAEGSSRPREEENSSLQEAVESTTSPSSSSTVSDDAFQGDLAVNRVYLAGLNRIITFPLKARPGNKYVPYELQMRLYFELAKTTGFFLEVDTVAQLMDCAKYYMNDVATQSSFDSDHQGVNQASLYALGSQQQDLTSDAGVYGASLSVEKGSMSRAQKERVMARQDQLAYTFLRHGIRGSNIKEDPWRSQWLEYQQDTNTTVNKDARVIGRYIAARDPWSSRRFFFRPGQAAEEFPGMVKERPVVVEEENGETSGGGGAEGGDESNAYGAPKKKETTRQESTLKRDPEAISIRCEDLKQLIRSSGSMQLYPNCHQRFWRSQEGVWTPMEVFTGQSIFLGRMLAGSGSSISTEVAVLMQEKLSELYSDLFEYSSKATDVLRLNEEHSAASQAQVIIEPEVGFLEAMLSSSTAVMDALAKGSAKTSSGADTMEAAFEQAANLRSRILQDCKTKWEGKFAALWMEQA